MINCISYYFGLYFLDGSNNCDGISTQGAVSELSEKMGEPYMNYMDVKEKLRTTNKDDWIANDELGTFTYKDDLNLRIERVETDRPFFESWATNFPDKNARATNYRVYYNNSYVDEKMLIDVDGYRATIPLPRSTAPLSFDDEDINFARIINAGERFDEYMETIINREKE